MAMVKRIARIPKPTAIPTAVEFTLLPANINTVKQLDYSRRLTHFHGSPYKYLKNNKQTNWMTKRLFLNFTGYCIPDIKDYLLKYSSVWLPGHNWINI